jgi:hypothetical protein
MDGMAVNMKGTVEKGPGVEPCAADGRTRSIDLERAKRQTL